MNAGEGNGRYFVTGTARKFRSNLGVETPPSAVEPELHIDDHSRRAYGGRRPLIRQPLRSLASATVPASVVRVI